MTGALVLALAGSSAWGPGAVPKTGGVHQVQYNFGRLKQVWLNR